MARLLITGLNLHFAPFHILIKKQILDSGITINLLSKTILKTIYTFLYKQGCKNFPKNLGTTLKLETSKGKQKTSATLRIHKYET